MSKNKIVLNNCYGGFRLSEKAVAYLKERLPQETWVDAWGWDGMTRHHPLLVEVVETLGDDAQCNISELVVVTTTEDRYRINDYDGMEELETPNQIIWTVIGGEG